MKHIIFIITLLFSNNFLVAQDPHFSQYNNSRMYTNPAFTGTDSTLVISAGYRMGLLLYIGGRIVWPPIDLHNKTFYFSTDQYIPFLKGGVGIIYSNDKVGEGKLTTSRIEINYAPHFEIFKHKIVLQPAFSAGFFRKSIDWSNLTFGDMIDERRGFAYNTNQGEKLSSKSNFDFSIGLLVYSNDFYGDFAVNHITQPDEGLLGVSKLPVKTTFHTGANLSFNTENFILSPNILLVQQQNFAMFLPGVNAKYKWAVIGLSYRSGNAFIIKAGVQNRFLKVGYSYDYSVAVPAFIYSGGVHEIQLTWFCHYQKSICKIKTMRLI